MSARRPTQHFINRYLSTERRTTRFIALVVVLVILLTAIVGGSSNLIAATDPGLPDTQLLAPYAAVQTITIYNGYNNPKDPATCTYGNGLHDHCDKQKYGLDLTNSNTTDNNVYMPLPGTIKWASGEFLGITTPDNLELWIGHFTASDVAYWNARVGQSVARGTLLGTRIDFHVHISMFDPTSGQAVPFTGTHAIEGINLDTQSDAFNAHAGETFTSTNPSWVAVGEVQLYKDPDYQGSALRVFSRGVVDLSTSTFMPWNNAISSIAIPKDWTVYLYEHPDKSGGSAAMREYTSNVRYFANDTFGDGTLVNDNVSAIEVIPCTTPSASKSGLGILASIFVKPALAASACYNIPTPGAPNPTLPPASNGIQVVSISPIEVNPGESFIPSVTVKVLSGQLDTADYLHATPEGNSNTFGAHPLQGVTRTVYSGQTFTFDSHSTTQFQMTAPQQAGSYQSVWRMHIDGQDTGPTIAIPITVRTVSQPHPYDYWNADYYTSKDLSGSVAYHTTISDQYLFKDWGIGSPAGNVPVDNWSGRFVREINFPGGDYHFHCQHDDGCRIYIDGQEKLNAWWDSSFDGHDWTGTLSAGLHEVKVEFYDQGGGAHLEVVVSSKLMQDSRCAPIHDCSDQ